MIPVVVCQVLDNKCVVCFFPLSFTALFTAIQELVAPRMFDLHTYM